MTDAARTPIDDLLDKQAITEVLYRYCRGCDRAEEQAIRACFHPESLHRHGGFEGTSADFTSMAMQIIRATKQTKHLLTNVLIELRGSMAYSESHYFAYHRQVDRNSGAELDYFTGGRYLDRFEERAGAWKIVQRVGLIDFERHETPDPGSRAPQSQLSQRFPEDELYRSFTFDRPGT
jgi:SnoaL-like domain